MTDPAQIPIRSTTQAHLPVEDIKNDIVIMKDGSAALVIEVSAVNFDLLSEREQDAIIYSYGALLNSLTFPIQILIRSQKKDISSYIELLEKEEQKKAHDQLLSALIKDYRIFVAETVKKNNVLDKKFYITVPFSSLELGVAPAIGASFRRATKLPYSMDYILEKAKNSLFPKRDQIMRLFARLGLKSRQLNNDQLTKLFYEIYNEERYRLGSKIEAKPVGTKWRERHPDACPHLSAGRQVWRENQDLYKQHLCHSVQRYGIYINYHIDSRLRGNDMGHKNN